MDGRRCARDDRGNPCVLFGTEQLARPIRRDGVRRLEVVDHVPAHDLRRIAPQQLDGGAEAIEASPELGFLTDWLTEVRRSQPVSKLERMQREMDSAIAAEAYEKAAELRDAIRALSARKS